MDIELFKAIVVATQALTAIFAAIIVVFSYKIDRGNLEQTQQNVYLKLYEIVQKHHSKEITDLRATIYSIKTAVEAASRAKTSLRESDPKLHSEVSALANYYESLGMFLQYRWEKFPLDSKTMMLAMLHNSVSKIWPLINEYKDAIYPNGRPRDWAQSFQWLHTQVQDYRSEHDLA
jgi:hypothetical protein